MEYYGPEPSGDEVTPVRARELCPIPDLSNLFNGDRPEWHNEAACRTTKDADIEAIRTNVNTFFPIRGESTKEAVEICDTCEVKEMCFEFGMALTDKVRITPGVWGGMSARARKKERKNKNSIKPH